MNDASLPAAEGGAAARGDLSGFRSVIVESRAALEAAYRMGLPSNARLRAGSPALILDPATAAEPIAPKPGRPGLRAAADAMQALSAGLYRWARAHRDYARFAATIARAADALQNTVAKAMCLTDADFEEPLLVLQVETGSKSTDALLNGCWTDLFAGCATVRFVIVPVRLAIHGRSRGGRRAPLGRRLRLAGSRALYGVVLPLSKLWPRKLRRGRAFVSRENELVKETALWLALRRFAVRRVALGRVEPAPDLPPLHALEEAVDDLGAEHLGPILCKPVLRTVLAAVRRRALADIARPAAATAAARALVPQEKSLFIANAPTSPEMAGLAEACRARGSVFVGVQHGIRREIANLPAELDLHNENVATDVMLAFGRRSAEISAAAPFASGPATAVGLPGDYYRLGRRGGRGILYVSTTLYLGYVQRLVTTAADHERARREVELFGRVLSGLPHPVTFKPYPSFRYADPCPIQEAARRAPGVTLYDEEIDLRYIVGDFDVLVTAGATSTIGWCALSGLPLVFIDWPDTMALSAEAKPLFRDAYFLFDGADTDFAPKLSAFLAQPLADIRVAAQAKAPARARLEREVFGAMGPGAGRRAAQVLCAMMGGAA